MNKNMKKRLMSLGVAATLAATAPAVSNLVEQNTESYEPNIKIEETNVAVTRPGKNPKGGDSSCEHTNTTKYNIEAADCSTKSRYGVEKCDDCGATISFGRQGLPGPHNMVTRHEEPTCIKTGIDEEYCSICGKVEKSVVLPIKPYKHTRTIDLPAKYPTCTEDGYGSSCICPDCNETLIYGGVIPALGHDIVVQPGLAATCTTDGLTTGHTCKRCGEVVKAQTVIPAKGHNYVTKFVKETCTQDGYKKVVCSTCGDVKSNTVYPATGHDFEIIVEGEPATCIDGLTPYKICRNCDLEVAQVVIPGKGHNFEKETIKPATCTMNGEILRYCTNCNGLQSETIPALGHHYVTDKGYAATYESTGLTDGSHCDQCGYVNVAQNVIPKLKPTAKPTQTGSYETNTPKPTATPTAKPTAKPTATGTGSYETNTPKPTAKPTDKPTATGTGSYETNTPKPTAKPSAKPTATGTGSYETNTPKPTAKATAKPTAKPTSVVTQKPVEKYIPIIDLQANNLFNKNLLLIETLGENKYSPLYDDTLALYLEYIDNQTTEMYNIVMEEFKKLYECEEAMLEGIQNEDVHYYYNMLNEMYTEYVSNYEKYRDQDPVSMIRKEIVEYYEKLNEKEFVK